MADRSACAPSDACWWQRGVIRRLDDLAALGIDAIWLSPSFCAPSEGVIVRLAASG